MKQKGTDGERVKALREQVFLWRYKSEPDVVESSVSRPSAYCQYCRLGFSVACGDENEVDKKH